MSEQDSLINAEQETKDEVGEVAERPEWLPEKFWNDGKPDYENLSKSYVEAEKAIHTKKEELSTQIKTEIEEERKKALPESPDNAGIDLFINSQPQYDLEAEKNKLGENANQRIEAVSLWVNKHFGEQEKPVLEMMCSTSNGVETVEKIMNMLQNSMSQAPESSIVAGKDRKDLEAMMKDIRYWHPTHRDDNYVTQINNAFEKLYK